jgi:hydroxypyruvate reductase
MADPKVELQRIFDAGVAAADPYSAVSRHLDGVTPPALIVTIGKAASLMAKAAMARFPGVRTIVVTNYENAAELTGAEVSASGHPVPDENGAAAARAVIGALRSTEGPVLALISGGGSALVAAPAGGLTLAQKAQVNDLLLGSGLPIDRMNLIRQQLSELKGGGFLRHASPQPVTALILSDVVGDDLSVIASGPTMPPIGTSGEAMALLHRANLWDRMPQPVRDHLMGATDPMPLPSAQNILVGSNSQSVAAMLMAAPEAKVIASPVEGDVRDAAHMICDQATSGITLWGGETTVVLNGTGRGGRNQELALRIAREASLRGWKSWTCLQAGSDGRDGPTDAAGAIVDQGTLGRIVDAGGDLDALLRNNDSYAALCMSGDLLITGATGTNVADLGILIREA